MSYRYVKLRIPTKAYLRKYLMELYLTEPIVVTKRDWVGNYLNHLVQRYGTDRHKYSNPKETEVLFAMPFEYLTRNGCYLSNQGINDFNNLLRKQFMNELFNHIEVARNYSPNLEIKDAIFDFMAKYSLDEEEISFEALKKAYFRGQKETAKA